MCHSPSCVTPRLPIVCHSHRVSFAFRISRFLWASIDHSSIFENAVQILRFHNCNNCKAISVQTVQPIAQCNAVCNATIMMYCLYMCTPPLQFLNWKFYKQYDPSTRKFNWWTDIIYQRGDNMADWKNTDNSRNPTHGIQLAEFNSRKTTHGIHLTESTSQKFRVLFYASWIPWVFNLYLAKNWAAKFQNFTGKLWNLATGPKSEIPIVA